MKIKLALDVYFNSYEEFENCKSLFGFLWSITVWRELEEILDEEYREQVKK